MEIIFVRVAELGDRLSIDFILSKENDDRNKVFF